MGPVLAEEPREIAGAHGTVHHHRRRQQTDITDAVGREGPHGRTDSVAAFEEEADEQRRRDAEQFPAGEQHVDAARQHHQIHAGSKDRQQQEEPGEPGLAMEILSREGIDQRAQTCREADVGHGKRIGHEFDVGLVVPHREPRPQVDDLRTKPPRRQRGEHEQSGNEPRGESAPHDSRRGPLRRRPAQQRGHTHEHQRGRRSGELADDQQRDDVVHGHRRPPIPPAAASTRAGGR